jgi:16S rRNA (cytosine967-C5)-methyltransferase
MVHDPRSPRAIALDVLVSCLRRRRALDDAIAAAEGLPELAPRDRAFVRLLVATALRRLGQIDALIAHCLERPLPPKAPRVHDILRLGVAQLLFLGTPPHAAADTSVRLVQAEGLAAFKGLVNAVLRRLAREGAALVANQDAARLNTPDWLWASWVAAYGADTARAIATAHLAEPPLDVTVKADAARWARALGAEILPTGTLRRPGGAHGGGGPVTELPGYAEGAWWVQDAAAAIPATLLGEVRGRPVIDLCAAPGGKTAQLAARGALVTAVDVSKPRLRMVRENLQRLGLEAQLACADASLWRPETRVPFVLLDAPCTATGTMRRHPDVARLKKPDDVARLVQVQDRLLDAAVEMLQDGGLLVFCTCSLQPEEGPQRVASLLQRAALARVPVTSAEVGGVADLVTPEGDLRTLPCHLGGAEAAAGGPPGGLDGFYAARLQRQR